MTSFKTTFIIFALLLCLPCHGQSVIDGRYFIVIKGSAGLIESLSLNEEDILGGAVRSVVHPIEVSARIKTGLNTLKLLGSDSGKNGLTIILQKRVNGPKIETVASLRIPNQTNSINSSVDFNIVGSAPEPKAKINSDETISATDKEEIMALLIDYLEAMRDKNITVLKSLFSEGIKQERRVNPELAGLRSQSLKQELYLLRNPQLIIHSVNPEKVVLKRSNSYVYASVEGNGYLVNSNLIELSISPQIEALVKQIDSPLESQLKKSRLKFGKVNNQWYLAIND